MNTDNGPKAGYKTVTPDGLEAMLGVSATFGETLRDIRTLDLGVSQVRFAQQLGVTKQVLCDIERGRRLLSVKAAMAIAGRLGYSARVFAYYVIRDHARAQVRKAGLKGTFHFDVAC